MAARIVVALTALSLLATGLGFLRELAIAYFFGASTQSDVLAVVIYVYEMIHLLFFQGGLAYVVVPLVAGFHTGKELEQQRDLVVGLLGWVLVGGLAFTLVAGAAAGPAAAAMCPGCADDAQSSLAWSARVAAVGLVCIAVASALASVLHGLSRYGRPLVGRLAWSAIAIAALVIAPSSSRFAWALVGLAVGAAAQASMNMLGLPGGILVWRLRAMRSRAALQALRLSIPAVAGLAGMGFALGLGERGLLALLPAGNIAMASYAQRSVNLASTAGLALMTVSFTEMAVAHRESGWLGAQAALVRGVRQGAFILAPATALFVLLGPELVRLLFQRGALSAEAAATSGRAAQFFAIALVPGILLGLLSRMLFVGGRAWAAVGVNGVVTAVALGFAALFLARLGLFAVPVGYALGLTVASLVAARLVGSITGVGMGEVVAAAGPAILAATAAGGVWWLVRVKALLVSWLGLAGDLGSLLALAAGSLLYVLAYIAACSMLGIREMQAAGRLVSRVMWRAGGGSPGAA